MSVVATDQFDAVVDAAVAAGVESRTMLSSTLPQTSKLARRPNIPSPSSDF
jgi:hypothetical protein